MGLNYTGILKNISKLSDLVIVMLNAMIVEINTCSKTCLFPKRSCIIQENLKKSNF